MRRGIGSLVAALAIVGVLGVATPDAVPDTVPRAAGPDGTARTDALAARMLSARVTTAITAPAGQTYTTDHRYVVVRWRAAALRDVTEPVPQVITRDGYRYDALSRTGLEPRAECVVGQALVRTSVFEVPADKVPGAFFAVGPRLREDVRTLTAVPTFPLPDLGVEAGPLAIEPGATEAAP